MNKFSRNSLKRLSTTHNDLQELFKDVIKTIDCTIIEGYRNKADQNQDFSEGRSQLKYPKSKHNKQPSIAVDVLPYINGRMVNGDEPRDLEDICLFAGFVLGTAQKLLESGVITHKIRLGADWNENWTVKDNWNDMPHYELML